MAKYRVLASVEVVVELPDDWDEGSVLCEIEDNSCPGTHAVGAAIMDAIEYGEENGVCWACNLKGANKLLGKVE